jgi:hypothetical protein
MELYASNETDEIVKKYFYNFVKVLFVVGLLSGGIDLFILNSPHTAKILPLILNLLRLGRF